MYDRGMGCFPELSHLLNFIDLEEREREKMHQFFPPICYKITRICNLTR